jgi:hypothetical protein
LNLLRVVPPPLPPSYKHMKKHLFVFVLLLIHSIHS